MPESAHTKVAVVVGVGPGLGAALARRFAAENAVALLARTPELLDSVAAEIESHGGRALQVPTNVTAGAEIEAAFATIRRQPGEPEVLLYNAAMRPFGRLMETKPRTFENTWRATTFAPFLCSQHARPPLLAAR